MVPEGWKQTRLEEHITIKHGFAFSSDYFVPNGEDIVLTPGNFYEEGGFRPLGEKQKRYDGPVPNDYILSPGDMLVAMTEQAPGLLGSTLFVPAEGRYLHNQRLGLIRKLECSGIDLRFLHLILAMPSIRRRISAESGGTKVKHTSPSKITGLDVLVPPLPEQRKIAEILSTWDRTIETSEALLATARTQKRALMQTLLTGKRRFPEFEGQDWREVRLVDVMQGKKVKGKIVPTNDGGLGVPYIGATSFEGNFSTYADADTAVLCDPSDLLVLWDGENAGAVAVGLRGAVSSTVVRFRFKPKMVSASFACAVMEMRNYQIRAVREGSGIPHMPKDFDQWFEFSLPTLAEQQKIMSVLDAAQAEIRMLVLQIEKLRTEKKALMQQLLTGKRRVAVSGAETGSMA